MVELTDGGININGLIAIIVFYLIILGIGIWSGRKGWGSKGKKQKTEDVMLAGRSIGLLLGSITLTATWVGGGYINGTAEVVAKPGYGLVMAQAPICYTLSLIVGGIFYAYKMRAAGYVTMLDPLTERFGKRMGGLLFLPALLAELLWTAAVLAALGASLQVILNLDNIVSIIISAAIAVLYTVIGGLYSVAYTDIIQLIFIPLGLWLAFPFALMHPAVGDPFNSTTPDWLGTYNVPNTGNYVDSIIVLICGGVPWQAYFQRVLGCKTPSGARYMSLIAGLGCFIMAVPAVLLGAVATVTDWENTAYNRTELEQYKLVLPVILQYLCPAAVSFVGLGAVSAAVMSSADSSLLSISSMFARNVYRNVFRPKASDKEIIWVMRFGIVLFGALAAICAIVIQSIYLLFYLCSDFVFVILFPQLTMVLYNKTVNTYGSACAFIVGLLFRLLGGDPIFGIPVIIRYPGYQHSEVIADQFQRFPYKTLSMVLSWITLMVVSYFTKWLFKTGKKLDLKYDVFNCYREKKEDDTEFDDIGKSKNGVYNPGAEFDSKDNINY